MRIRPVNQLQGSIDSIEQEPRVLTRQSDQQPPPRILLNDFYPALHGGEDDPSAPHVARLDEVV
jgi:hypothetical protein